MHIKQTHPHTPTQTNALDRHSYTESDVLRQRRFKKTEIQNAECRDLDKHVLRQRVTQ